MNTDDNAWESAMSRDFDARVRNLHESPLSLDDVKGKAGKIRRRRRTAVAGGVLAAAAVIVPTAVLVGAPGNDDSAPDPADTPSVTTELSVGPAQPQVDYIRGNVWHRADGAEVDLSDGQQYVGGVIWDDKLVVESLCCEGDRSQVDIIDADGTVVDSFFSNGGVVVNEAGTTLAWVDDEDNIVTRSAAGDFTFPGSGTLLALEGGPNCDPAADGCTVYTDYLTYESDGGSSEPPDALRNGQNDAAAGGRTATTEFPDDYSSCGGYFRHDGTRVWRTCDYSVMEIAPGGQYVVGTDNYLDGYGRSFLAILDAETGEEIARYETPQSRAIPQWTWADDTHLLMSVYDYDERAFHLLLLGPGGTVTDVADPVPGEDLDYSFGLIRR